MEGNSLNPLRNSTFSEAVNLGQKNLDHDVAYLEDKNTKARFFEIKENPEVQAFVALLSKGILHTSDIIEKDGRFYSKEMQLKDFDSSKISELEAELFLLHYLFADYDRWKFEDSKAKSAALGEQDPDKEHHKNYISSKDKFVHYDYGQAMGNKDWVISPFHFKNETPEELEYNTRAFFEEDNSGMNLLKQVSDKKEFFLRINEKLNEFEKNLKDQQFLDAIAKKSKINLGAENFDFLSGNTEEEKLSSLQDYLLTRVKVLQKISDPKGIEIEMETY